MGWCSNATAQPGHGSQFAQDEKSLPAIMIQSGQNTCERMSDEPQTMDRFRRRSWSPGPPRQCFLTTAMTNPRGRPSSRCNAPSLRTRHRLVRPTPPKASSNALAARPGNVLEFVIYMEHGDPKSKEDMYAGAQTAISIMGHSPDDFVKPTARRGAKTASGKSKQEKPTSSLPAARKAAQKPKSGVSVDAAAKPAEQAIWSRTGT